MHTILITLKSAPAILIIGVSYFWGALNSRVKMYTIILLGIARAVLIRGMSLFQESFWSAIFQGALISGVPSFQGCPHFRVPSFQGCPHFRGALISGCLHFRGALISGVSSFQGCPHFRMPSFQGCPYFRLKCTQY